MAKSKLIKYTLKGGGTPPFIALPSGEGIILYGGKEVLVEDGRDSNFLDTHARAERVEDELKSKPPVNSGGITTDILPLSDKKAKKTAKKTAKKSSSNKKKSKK